MTRARGLFTAPLPIVAAYLRSVFQAEGYVVADASALVVVGARHDLREARPVSMQQLLMRFGIFSRVRSRTKLARPHGAGRLSIQSAGDRRRFADEIGFVDASARPTSSTRRFELPGLARQRDEATRDRTHRGARRACEVYDIQTESGEYLSNHLRVHNCFILAVDDTMDGILNWYREEGTIFKGGSGSGINLSQHPLVAGAPEGRRHRAAAR